ncbi:HotDog domain-containing protein [Lipomyces oligophaga]|uniref:HotDog domain-containing protein n=1 Tax=Lipomyces oligophaga TaxID=45792 RepID=UPI0034CDFFAD
MWFQLASCLVRRQLVVSSAKPIYIRSQLFATSRLALNVSATSTVQSASHQSVSSSPISPKAQPPLPPPPPSSSAPRPQRKRGLFFRLLGIIVKYAFIPVFGVSTGYYLTFYVRSSNDPVKIADDPDTEDAVGDTRVVYDPVIDAHIDSLPLVKELRADPDFIELRPHGSYPHHLRENSLTAGVLAGPGMVEVPPILFSNLKTHELIAVIKIGEKLCGHEGVVHGGFLATLLDEGLCRCGFPTLPHKVGVTATLSVDYRAPTQPDDYYVLRAKVTKSQGRKVWVKGHIETVPSWGKAPKILVESEVLCVEPKWAASLPNIGQV